MNGKVNRREVELLYVNIGIAIDKNIFVVYNISNHKFYYVYPWVTLQDQKNAPRAAISWGVRYRLIVGLFAAIQPFGNEMTNHISCDRRNKFYYKFHELHLLPCQITLKRDRADNIYIISSFFYKINDTVPDSID